MKLITKEEIFDLVYQAIDEFNQMQEEDEQLSKRPEEILFTRPGYTAKGVLDSMGLVNLLISVDEVLDNNQKTVDINFDINHLLEKKESLLTSIESLVNHIYELSQK